jgi:TRAP transporter TAXI family solute receptor
VSLTAEGSGTVTTAREILAAFRLSEKSFAASYVRPEQAVELMQNGKLDAFFIVGSAPINLVAPLLAEDVAVLVPIDGEGRERLLQEHPSFSAAAIAPGIYPGAASLETVSVSTLWITDVSQPDALIYGMVKALYNPANRAAIEAQHLNPHALELASAVKGVEALLHPGAERFYTEAGPLKRAQPQPQPDAQAAKPPAPDRKP